MNTADLTPAGAMAATDGSAAGSGPHRLHSLDVFRGATIAGMILVNNAGDWSKTFWPLLHAPWHGWTPTDLVFPFFLFIVGVAIPFALALKKSGERLPQGSPVGVLSLRGTRIDQKTPLPRGLPVCGEDTHERPLQQPLGRQRGALVEVANGESSKVHRKIARRATILFLLGLVLIWFPFYTVSWERARIFGVLQRIAIVYLLAALAYVHLGWRARAWLSAALLSGYWAVMMWVPVPGFGRGDLSAAGNVAGYVDQVVLGLHIWRYAPGPADPEGLLTTVPALVSALLGLFVGEWLRSARGPRAKVIGLVGWGAVTAAAGLALDRWFPINKNLWSPPYVLLTTGLAMLCLALLYRVVDVGGRRRWALPLTIFGTNSIAAYVGSSLLARLLTVIRCPDGAGGAVTLQKWLYVHWFSAHLPPYWASLGWALATVLLWLAVLTVLYRRRWFWRV